MLKSDISDGKHPASEAFTLKRPKKLMDLEENLSDEEQEGEQEENWPQDEPEDEQTRDRQPEVAEPPSNGQQPEQQ